MTRNESPYGETKRERAGTEEKGTPNIFIKEPPANGATDGFTLDNSSPTPKERERSPDVTSSESDSTSSSEDESTSTIKKPEEKENGVKPIWEVLDKPDKDNKDKKKYKNTNKSSGSMAFRSNDNTTNPESKKGDSKKNIDGGSVVTKRHQRKRKCKFHY